MAAPAVAGLLVPAPAAAVQGDGLSVQAFGALGDGSTDDTAAFRDAIDAAKAQAQRVDTGLGVRYDRLPTLYLPPGRYRVSGTIALHYLAGFRIAGAGPRSSIIEFLGSGTLFDIHRSFGVLIEDIGVCNVHPDGPKGPLRGLTEDSTAFEVHERHDDAQQPTSNTVLRFQSVHVNEFHYGFRFTGDQMGDNVVFDQVGTRDNFHDFSYENVNSVNHQRIGGETLYAVSFPESYYAARLSSWQTSPAVYDGAVLNAVNGGQHTMLGGSIIASKTTVLFRRPTVATTGADAQVAPYAFLGTRWEWRKQDTGGDRNGLERVTLVRYTDPWPSGYAVSNSVRFRDCEHTYGAAVPRTDLVHVANHVHITWENTRVLQPDRARLVELVDRSTTGGALGSFVGRRSTILPTLVRTPAGTGAGPLRHVVDQAGGASIRTATAATQPLDESHTLVPGVARPVRRVIWRSASAALPGTGGAPTSVTVTVPPGEQAMIVRVGVVLAPGVDSSGAMAFGFSVGGRLLAALSVDTGKAAARVGPYAVQYGRMPQRQLEDLAPGDGQVVVTASQTRGVPLSGYVFVEYV